MRVKDEAEGRQLLADYGRKLVETGLVQGTWGNISVRLDDNYMLTTPSGLDYTRLTPADMVKVDIKTLKYDGELKPTSEKALHAGVYISCPSAGGVIHTHAKYCSIFAAAHMPLQVEDPSKAERIGEVIKVADYGLPGTKKLTANTLAAISFDGDHRTAGCMMANHGMICYGEDIEDVFDKCGVMEKAAEEYIENRWKK